MVIIQKTTCPRRAIPTVDVADMLIKEQEDREYMDAVNRTWRDMDLGEQFELLAEAENAMLDMDLTPLDDETDEKENT